jgi:2-methylcitrate dehydratase PrpD
MGCIIVLGDIRLEPQKRRNVMSLTSELANFAVSSRYEEMPVEAVNVAKDCILDCLEGSYVCAEDPET